MSATVIIVSPEELASLVEGAVRAALRDIPAANEPMVTVAEAARRLGVSPRTIRRRVKDGSLRAVGQGRGLRVDARSLSGPDENETARAASVAIAEARR